jgi:hypothetical protein
VASGALLAVESADGEQLAKAATTLLDTLVERELTAGISRWDASGLFGDVATAPRVHRDVSPRSLLLLYAADLAFRIRWEISPVLQNGGVVIAAPYVTTAVTFGLATGLSREWLLTLFRFAPRPARTAVLRGGKRTRVWKRDPERGFAECCTTLLESTPEGFARRKTRAAMEDALSTAADQHGGLYRKRDFTVLVDEVVTPRGRRGAPTPPRRPGR